MTLLRIALVFSIIGSFVSTGLAQNWMSLFDGVSLSGWTNDAGESVTSPAWEVVDGTLHLDRSQGRGGNLLSMQTFGDFELMFEWKVAAGANNGIKYRVQKFGKRTLGLEYQVIDDAAHPGLRSDQRTASIYDVFATRDHDVLRPAGEFNRGRIVVKNGRIQHWLNGHLVTEAHVGSPAWDEAIANSKFAEVDGFGRNRCGKIMLTDHNDEVWYRNVFIRDLTCSLSSDDLVLGTGCCNR